MMPFDPDAGAHPPALESLFARPAATVPAVLIVAGAAARRDGWAARAAIAVAEAWAERRSAITVADLSTEPAELAAELDAAEAEGLADIFEFGVSLGRAAREVPDRHFRFLSAGLYVPDLAALLEHPRWERVISQHAEEQATLLVYVPSNAPGLETLARRVGRVLVLTGANEADRIAAALPSNCSVLAALQAPAPAASPPRGDDEASDAPHPPEATSEASRVEAEPVDAPATEAVSEEETLTEPGFVQRELPRRRRVSPVLWVLLVVVLALGAWVGAQEFLGRGAGPAIDETAAQVGDQMAEGTPPTPEPIEVPLSYSVAVEAHPDFEVAVERVKALRDAEPQIPFYVAPIVVDGVVYHRILSGMVADTAGANALMRRLVDAGHKTEIDTWAIRPTVWSFLIGEFGTAEAATAKADSLLTLGVPTYSVEVPYTHGPARFRLYAGAYEAPAQGVVMGQLLEKAGIETQLARRMGPPPE